MRTPTAPLLPRRDVLRLAGGLVLLAGGSRVARAADAPLPAPASLKAALEQALQRGHPLIVMVSLDGCPYCRIARQNYLTPLFAEQKIDIVQLDIQSQRAVDDFDGRATTHDALIRGWKIRVTPTLLFYGAGAREVVPRLAGVSSEDFYGAYLERRIADAEFFTRR